MPRQALYAVEQGGKLSQEWYAEFQGWITVIRGRSQKYDLALITITGLLIWTGWLVTMASMGGIQNKVNRRQFIGQCAHTVGSMSILGLLLGSYSKQSVSTPAWAIRPPGAIAEDDFLGACVRCGLCVRDCPYDTLKLAEFGSEVATGTPYFIAREIPCEMCEDIPCVAACPTDALSKELTDIRDADMGIAVLTGPDTCYSVTGVAHCRACYIACPIKDEAITMEQKRVGNRTYFEPTVHAGRCTGCGKCEENCVTPEASIKVLPRQLAKHDSGNLV